MTVTDTLISIGDRVVIRGNSEIHGIINAILMTDAGMEYRFVYWSDGERKMEWVYSFEIIKVN